MPRGQKTCPKCKATTGPRTKVCPGCGYQYIIGQKPPVGPPTRPASETPGPPVRRPISTVPPGPPVRVPKPEADAWVCPTHPKYIAAQPPTGDCEACWRMYLRSRFENRVKPLDPAHVFPVNDPRDLRRFIDALESALKRSTHTGGSYAAFLHTKDGQTIQIAVWLSQALARQT